MTESEKPSTRRPGAGRRPGARAGASRRRFDGRPQHRQRRSIAVESMMQRQEVRHTTPKEGLRVFALGGLEEVGRNMSVLEYGDNILIIDMGLQFPEEDMPGIDYIIPNTSYLRGKEKNIVGVIITHAHYDHIGGIPHLIPR
ncbi:MAG TPA: MBL fold metallo-hydrolase, partial [Candidatus Paceibacterota bacterium]